MSSSREWVAVVAAAALQLAASCSSPAPEQQPEPPPDLAVTVQQQRVDESTRTVGVEATNLTDAPVHVSAVRLAGGGLDGPTTPLDTDLQPDLTVALRTSYGRPHCENRSGPVVAHLRLGERTLAYAVDAAGQQEVRRLVERDCAAILLSRTADVRLSGPYREVVVDNQPWLRGRLMMARRAPGPAVDLRSLAGSVLIDLRPVNRLVDLGTEAKEAETSVLLGSNGRCDAHALGGSTQTFLLSAYVRLGDHAEQRVVLTPPGPVQDRVLDVVGRACGTSPK